MLRQTFRRWGLPDKIRVDNGAPWGSTRQELPSELCLWLIGLQVGVIHNHAHRPQENGVVERLQGVLKSWSEPEGCRGIAQFRRRLARAVYLQRECYEKEHEGKRARRSGDLSKPRRTYDPLERQWDLSRVLEYLAKGVWRRLVDSTGRISLYGWSYRVGADRSGHDVWVRLQPETGCWQISDEQGNLIVTHQAIHLDRSHIVQLKMARPRAAPRGA